MIEHEGKKYFTTYELLDFVNNSESDLGKAWAARFPKFKKTVLMDQLSRVLTGGRQAKQIKFLEFKKNEKSSRVFFAYAPEDVVEYLKTYSKKVYNIKLHNKGEGK